MEALYDEAIRDTIDQFEPAGNLPDYSREEFIEDLLGEHEKETRGWFEKGAYKVQIDFTEGRLAVKIDKSGWLLNGFIELNNLALSRFSEQERSHIGVHTCPGSDRDSTHSADVHYAELLPSYSSSRRGIFTSRWRGNQISRAC